MKTKISSLLTVILISGMLTTSNVLAQQPKYSPPVYPGPHQIGNRQIQGNYTYYVFTAPTKSLGYYILLNGRMIFHQPASLESRGINKAALIKKEQADKAAILSIEKLKNGLPPQLSKEEILKLTAY